MDPRTALQQGNWREYNEWCASDGFMITAGLPEPYDLGKRGGALAYTVRVVRVYRGHRCLRARCERLGGQGFVTVNLKDLYL